MSTDAKTKPTRHTSGDVGLAYVEFLGRHKRDNECQTATIQGRQSEAGWIEKAPWCDEESDNNSPLSMRAEKSKSWQQREPL